MFALNVRGKRYMMHQHTIESSQAWFFCIARGGIERKKSCTVKVVFYSPEHYACGSRARSDHSVFTKLHMATRPTDSLTGSLPLPHWLTVIYLRPVCTHCTAFHVDYENIQFMTYFFLNITFFFLSSPPKITEIYNILYQQVPWMDLSDCGK